MWRLSEWRFDFAIRRGGSGFEISMWLGVRRNSVNGVLGLTWLVGGVSLLCSKRGV